MTRFGPHEFSAVGPITRRTWAASRPFAKQVSSRAAFRTLSALLPLMGAEARAQVADPLTPQSVVEMSLEDLMSLSVTSVAGVEHDWFATPAAIDVITGDDVRRSGFRTLADALRLAPGVFVGRTSSQGFSVGMRGFNGSLANKTLVLIDGRTGYDPLFGGTFWDVQDILLEDLDRIEVIRGPGATLWGANAVNGVINVITKSAKDTQGGLVSAGVGSYERAFGQARYGFQVGENSWLRLYGKWLERDSLDNSNDITTHDDWSMLRGGFRFDREDGGATLTVQGDAYDTDRVGEFAPMVPVPGQTFQFVTDLRDGRRRGGNLLMRIAQEEDDHGWSFQTYYDRTERLTDVSFEVNRDTLDADWRHHFRVGERHDVMWGLGARHTRDETADGGSLLLDPDDGSLTTLSAFVQDTITLEPEHWFAMVGSKFLHNDYTGFEVQPSARLWWTPNDRHTVWTSISRPVRVPTRVEVEGTVVAAYFDSGLFAGGPPSGQIIPLGIEANDDLDSERLLAYEAGYRVRVTDEFTIDTALFFNDYDRLIFVSGLGPWNNESDGETYGGELALTWRPADNWTLEGSYSYVDVHIHGLGIPADEDYTPHNQAQIRSYLGVTEDIDLNAAMYYVDNVPWLDVDAYTRLDVGVTWRPSARSEISLWGQNLLEAQHREFSSNEVERGVYIMATFRF